MFQHQDSLSPTDTSTSNSLIPARGGRPAAALSSSLRATLLTAPLLDELMIGILVVAMPLIRDEFHLTYEQVGFLFTVGTLSSIAIEPLINLLSDHSSKRLIIVGGLLSLVMSYIVTGASSNYGMLVLAFALISPGIGVALDLAQATLIDAASDTASHTMTRWTIMASVGDILAPLTVGVVTSMGLSWRLLCVFGAAVWLGAAIVVWPQRFPPLPDLASSDDADEEGSRWQQLRLAFINAMRDRTLLRWAGVVLLCTMLDEVFLAFMGLYLRDALHASAGEISLALGSLLVGGMAGLVVLDRWHVRLVRRGKKMKNERVLLWLALFTLAYIVILLLVHNFWITTIALFFIGAGVAGWYPLAKAAAYDTRPGSTGVVRAVISIGAPFETVLPTLVGVIAAHFGILAGIAFLGLAPLGVLVLTPRSRQGITATGDAVLAR